MKSKYLLLLMIPSFYQSQFTTERPGESNSSEVISDKSMQLESGLTYLKDNNGFSSFHLLRYGITKDWEIRLETDQDLKNGKENYYGFSTKYNLINSEASSTSVSIIGVSDFKFENYSASLAADQSLTEHLGFLMNVGYERADFVNNLALTSLLEYKFSDKFSAFAEYYGHFNANISPDHNADFGFSYLAAPRLKLDLSAGSNVTHVSKNYFVSSGLSYKFW